MKRTWILLTAVLLIFAIYLMTITPGIFWRDSAEFVMIPFNLDIGHPAGSPTFTMLAGAFSRIPIGSIAFRSNLATAIFGALAFLPLFFAALMMVRKISPELPLDLASAIGAAAVAPFFFCTGYWYWVVSAEVYSAMIGALALAIGFTLKTPDYKPADIRVVLTVAFVLGLGCGLHMVLILYAPAFGIYLFLTRRSDFSIVRILAFCAVFLTGFSVFLLLPVRSAANPPFDYGNPENLSGFLFHITGRKYSHIFKSMPWLRILENSGYLAKHLLTQLSFAHVVFAMVGVFVLARKNWRILMFLVLIAVGHFYLYIRDWKADFGYIPIYFLVALSAAAALGWGVNILVQKCPGRAKPLAIVFVVIAVFSAGIQAKGNWAQCDRAGHDLLERQTRNLLGSLPPDAILVSYEDNINYASVFAQSIERWREDVIHFHRAYLEIPEYLKARHSDLDVRPLDGQPWAVYRFLMQNARSHTPFWDFGWETPQSIPIDRFLPYGRLMLVSNEAPPDLDLVVKKSDRIWDNTMAPVLADPHFNEYDWTAIEVTARFFSGRSKYYFDVGATDLARKTLHKAIELRPDFASFYGQLAALDAKAGNVPGAFENAQQAVKKDPLDYDMWTLRGNLALSAKLDKVALESFMVSLKINNALYQNAFYTARGLYQTQAYKASEKYARMGMKYATDPEWLGKLKEICAMALIRQRKFKEAKNYLLDLLETKPTDPRIKQLISLCDQEN